RSAGALPAVDSNIYAFLMSLLLLAAQKETLAWFLGNTFALAAWWVISGFISGVFLSMFGGTVSFMLTGRMDSQLRTERLLGTVGGALIGMSGRSEERRVGEECAGR